MVLSLCETMSGRDRIYEKDSEFYIRYFNELESKMNALHLRIQAVPQRTLELQTELNALKIATEECEGKIHKLQSQPPHYNDTLHRFRDIIAQGGISLIQRNNVLSHIDQINTELNSIVAISTPPTHTHSQFPAAFCSACTSRMQRATDGRW